MKRLLACCLAWGILIGASAQEADWTRVYPEIPVKEDMELLSLHSHVQYIPYPWQPPRGPQGFLRQSTLIGSRDGYSIVNYSGVNGPWTTVQLPFAFDITAVASLGSQWIIGGSGGRIAVHQKPHDIITAFGNSGIYEVLVNDLQEGWVAFSLPTNGTVTHLIAFENRLVAVAGQSAFQSTDAGESWQPVAGLDRVYDLETINGRLFVLSGKTIDDQEWVDLLWSEDGESWNSVREFYKGDQNPGELFVQYENNFPGSLTNPGSGRLYFHRVWSYSNGSSKWIVSTLDGKTWIDHGSETYTYNFPDPSYSGPSQDPANPFGVPESQRFVSPPTRLGGVSSGNFHIDSSIYGYRLEHYESGDWSEVFSSGKVWNSRLTSTQWGSLAFAQNNWNTGARIVRIETDGTITEFPLPDLDLPDNGLPEPHVKQLINVADRYYAILERGHKTEAVVTSPDLVHWEEIPHAPAGFANNWSVRLFAMGNQLASFHEARTEELGERRFVSLWDGEKWTQTYYTAREPDWSRQLGGQWKNSRREVTWWPRKQAIASLFVDGDEVFINQLVEGGEPTTFARFTPETWNGYFKRLACPDGERLIAYGDSAELGIIEPDGTVRTVHPWNRFPENDYRIDSVRFIDGWYYLAGSATLRTRDFETFETVVAPEGHHFLDFRYFNGDLYGFTRDTVFKVGQPLGWLDSIEHDLGWRFSEWLGWFRIIDQQAGRIEHLFFGPTTIDETRNGIYILETKTLGQLAFVKDWFPWLQALPDGDWYRLDHDQWPPRIWNGTTESWVDLVP
jgi:hypothetical protein